jgi:YfiH family protein
MLRQVHGIRLVSSGAGYALQEADGFLLNADRSMPVAGVRTADCVPVLLANPVSGHGAVIHSGWRGTAAGIVPLAVAVLAGRGSRPGDLTAALGPAIGGCCYRVGPEVVRAMGGAGVVAHPGPVRIDLRQAIRLQLEAAGVPAFRISTAPWCTFCEESLYFSWRRESGTAGRMLSVLGVA